MRTQLWFIGVAGLLMIGAGTTIAQETRPTPLEGRGASIEYRVEGEPDIFTPGAVLFTNRPYTVAECPEWLKGKRFLRGSIDYGSFRVTAAGVLTLLTPEPVHPRAATQHKLLEERGFVWDRGYVQSIGNICTVRGDQLWIYYTGFQGDVNKLGGNWLQNGMYARGATGVAFLRRDGFASMDAAAAPATLTTRPVTFSGTHVFVNTATAAGELRVEILDEAGEPLARFTRENCRPIRADSTLEPVVWTGADDVSALQGKTVRFRFTLHDGSLYAFWVSQDESGRSDGYVAGGGPGFTGMTDTQGRTALEAEQRQSSSKAGSTRNVFGNPGGTGSAGSASVSPVAGPALTEPVAPSRQPLPNFQTRSKAGTSEAAAVTTAETDKVPSPSKKARTLDYAGQLAVNLEPTRVLVYKQVGGRELHLNIFEPEGHKPADRRACFFSIHGGGWTGLEPRRQYPFAAHFAKLGLVGICIEYRLVKRDSVTTVFDCVKDSRSAMRYVRAHAAELGIDPQQIIANGGSAGGHLAVGTALFDGVDEAGEDTSVSCVPNAIVLYFPVIDTSRAGYGNAKIGARWQELSPLHHVRPDVPPTLILHGTGDTVTPFAGAQGFCDAMLKAGNRCELIPTAGAAHGYLMRERAVYELALRQTEAFLASLGFIEKR